MHSRIGITKHMGGLSATKKLIEGCKITENSYVLDVGCGVGVTTCYLAKNIGCNIVGIDLSDDMLKWARERAEKKKLTDKVKFMQADAAKLPFDDNTFDAVISESVTTFIEDKQAAIEGYKRVVKPRGYIGLNEEVWVKPPTPEMTEYTANVIGGAKPIPENEWVKIMNNVGLQDVTSSLQCLSIPKQFIDELKLRGIGDTFSGMGRLISLFIFDAEFRKDTWKMARDAKTIPKGLMDSFRNSIFIGRK